MTDMDTPSIPRARPPVIDGRPVRKDEIELPERGLYVESWLPERRSRRKPLLFVHGELGGSWLWERYLGYFASRGWEGHALNLRNHFWSQTAAAGELSFDSYLEDVIAVMARLGPNVVVVGHGMDVDVLERAGIADADAAVVATNGDNTNVVVGQVVQRRYNTSCVVVRKGPRPPVLDTLIDRLRATVQ